MVNKVEYKLVKQLSWDIERVINKLLESWWELYWSQFIDGKRSIWQGMIKKTFKVEKKIPSDKISRV